MPEIDVHQTLKGLPDFIGIKVRECQVLWSPTETKVRGRLTPGISVPAVAVQVINEDSVPHSISVKMRCKLQDKVVKESKLKFQLGPNVLLEQRCVFSPDIYNKSDGTWSIYAFDMDGTTYPVDEMPLSLVRKASVKELIKTAVFVVFGIALVVGTIYMMIRK